MGLLFSDESNFLSLQKSHVLRIIRAYQYCQNQENGYRCGQRYASNMLKKKAIWFVLSDFMDSGYANTMVVGKKHDVTGIRIYGF